MSEEAFFPPAFPTAPTAPTPLDDEQLRFMLLHDRHVVNEWKWFMQNNQLRAKTDRGAQVYISAEGLGDLIAEGLVAQGAGTNACYVTTEGRAKLRELGR